jgi:antitoxin component YwqK of YwqJK toxin-antitoxin module
MKTPLFFICVLLPCRLFAQTSEQKDTLYFDDQWQLSNIDNARHYRVGTLDSARDKIFFHGPVTDYYINGDIEMEGEYSIRGEKDGIFVFYYPGKLKAVKAKGVFRSNEPYGTWEFYYEHYKPQHHLLFPGSEFGFGVIDHWDENGKQTCKDGNGEFVLELESESSDIKYELEGGFSNGSRDNVWKYSERGIKGKELAYRETYNKGQFKNGITYGYFGRTQAIKSPLWTFSFPIFKKFKNTDLFKRSLGGEELPLADTITAKEKTQLNDTVYYNEKWQICERIFAEYYRLGEVKFDSLWSYSGPVHDYYKNNTLVMEGNYSDSGTREGLFTFYHNNGNISGKGKFQNNLPVGAWDFYYDNGRKKATLVFSDNSEFNVTDYYDKQGNSLCKDGSCYFELEVIAGESLPGKYLLKGEFTKGKRTGTWQFWSKVNGAYDFLYIKEIYAKGVLQKGILYTRREDIKFYTPWKLMLSDFEKLDLTESFTKDPTSFTNFNFDNDIRDLLVYKKSPDINLAGNSINESLYKLARSLNQDKVLKLFNEPGKMYNGVIEFRVSDSGSLKDIGITGNFSSKEKEDLLYILSKFRNIEEVIVGSMGIDAYYKFYYYTLDLTDVVPKRFRNDPKFTKIFAFWPEKMQKVKEIISEPIKKILRYYF